MIIKSNNHDYIFNKRLKFLFSIHPLINYFYEYYKEGEIDVLKKVKLNFHNLYTIQEIEDYYSQFIFLKENFLKERHICDFSFGYLTGEQIIKSFNSCKQIIFEITEKCNLACTYCIYGKCYIQESQRTNQSMQFAIAKNTIDYFKPIWQKIDKSNIRKNITISFYGGEPLLNNNFILKVVDYCNELGFSKDFFRFSMTTNGILLDKYKDFLIKNNFFVTVSLDGNKENNAYRLLKNGNNSYNIIYKNLKKLQKYNPTYFNTNVQFNSVIHRKNSLSEIVSYFLKEFNQIPNISPLTIDNLSHEFTNTFKNIYKDIYEDITSEVVSKINEVDPTKFDIFSFFRKNCQHNFNNFISINSLGKKPIVSPTGTCIPFSRKIYITTSGKIYPCESIPRKQPLGIVSANDGVCLDVNEAAEYFNRKTNQFLNLCQKCYNRNSCGVCIFNQPNPPCNQFVDKTNFKKQLSTQISILENYPEWHETIKKIITT